jgi:energy-coupling factor transporter ATP-binding protein EcfA2
LIAIKVLDNQNKRYTKNLLKDELYQFNKNFEFENNVIKYYKTRDMDIYKIDNIDISINIIVGENGSGKSTLLELAFMIINNISRRIFETNGLKNEGIQVEYIDDINAELYFVTDHLYKIKVNDKIVTVEKFEQIDFNDENISYGKATDCTNYFSFDNLYYTNHINYSLHSLNQNYFGDWIYNLFHKNDGYQIPIVLEPYRDKGNIDINLLQSLMKSRLLSYILDNSNESFRQLTKKVKAKKIVLTVDYFKFLSIEPNVPTKEDFTNLAKNLTNVFNSDTREVIKIVNEFIDNSLNNVSFDENLFINDGDDLLLKPNFKDVPIEFFFMMYIFYKLDSIVKKYKEFEKYKNYKNENNLKELLKVIKKDTSHSTFKIRQAIYNLKYLDTLNFQNTEIPFEIDVLSNILENEILAKESAKDLDLRIDDLIPSSIFKVDIILENEESFDSLSSGEKQKIFVINSIMYHLKNIASKDNGYRNINIVLDEIELYFHPEMQRDFINNLLEMLKNNDYINNLYALNFIFITHSPFILSDVIDNNLLMLNQLAEPLKENKKTFGANLYDLLHDGFFMDDGFIGKFAEKKIKQIIDIIKLYKALKAKDDTEKFIESYKDFFGKKAKIDNTEILSHIEESKNKLLKIVNSIGEPLLRNKLEEEIKILFEIDDITEIVNSLKNKKNEDIEKELENYSQYTQTKVLMKLLEIRK